MRTLYYMNVWHVLGLATTTTTTTTTAFVPVLLKQTLHKQQQQQRLKLRYLPEVPSTGDVSSSSVAPEVLLPPPLETRVDVVQNTDFASAAEEDDAFQNISALDDHKTILASSLEGDHVQDIPALLLKNSLLITTTSTSSTATTPAAPSSSLLENVEAVLALSEQAAKEADASINISWVAPSAPTTSQKPEIADRVEIVVAGTTSTTATDALSLSMDIGSKLRYESARKRKNNAKAKVKSIAVVDENADTAGKVQLPRTIEAPSVGKILRFAVPAIGVWLCSPLLSLIDTSAVGLLSGTAQQAALNPAVAVTDYAALLLAFLFTGSTNLIAAARESDRVKEGCPRTTRTLIGALQLSTFVGTALGAVLYALAPMLLRSIIGNDALGPEVFGAALKYVRIRALAMPAAAVMGSAQAACLGMQDIRSPLYVLLAAAIVNFCGDMMFVGSSHPWLGGAAGAAWATVFSQYAALAMFVHWVCNPHRTNRNKTETTSPPKILNVSKAIMELTGKPTSPGEGRRRRFRQALRQGRLGMILTNNYDNNDNPLKMEVKSKKPSSSSFSIRGFLQGKFTAMDLFKAPPKETVQDFQPYLVPVTATVVGRVSGYVAMSHVVSSSLGTISMAALQVILSIFNCLCPIADSLSLTAQSFVPGIAERKPSPERSLALRKTISSFLKAAAVFGAITAGVVVNMPLLSGLCTSDPAVASLVNTVAPQLVIFFAVHGIVLSAEGILLGQKDLGFLGRMYGMFFGVVPFLMLRLKRVALSSSSNVVNLTSVWNVFAGYQIFRTVAWAARVAVLQQRTEQTSSSSVSS